MANKRNLKKMVHAVCNDAITELIIASRVFDDMDRNKVYSILRRLALLKLDSLKLINVSYDKTPKAFDTPAGYRRARRAYYRGSYGKMLKEFGEKLSEIVHEMNAAMPPEARGQIKKFLSEE